jgi:hypothetical protein
MNKKQNIEDVFRQGFDDFQIKPSGKVWNGINKQMAAPRLEASYKNAFEGFRISPSEQIWRRVAAAVWVQRFIHFSPFSFNIYYLAIISSAIIGTIAVINNNTNLDFVDFDENKYLVQNSDSLSIDQNQIESFEAFVNVSAVENQIADFVEKQQIIVEPIIKDDPSISDVVVTKNEKLIGTRINSQDNINTSVIDQNDFTGESKTDNNDTFVESNIVKSDIGNDISNNLVNNYDVKSTQKLKGVIANPTLTPNRIFINNNKFLSYKPQWFEKADLVFVGLPDYDEIVKDTIGYNYKGEPVIVDKSWFELGSYYSPYLFDVKSKTLNQELVSNNLMFNNGVQPKFSWSAGLSLSYNYNRFRIESGLMYGTQSEEFLQMIKAYDTLTVYSYNYFENSDWNYDTTLILDLDEFLQGNIVYIPYIDSTQFYFNDSIMVSMQDSVLQDKLLTAGTKMSYIGVPIIGGYEFASGKFVFTPKIGVVFGILQNQTGTGYRISDGKIVEVSALEMNKFTLNYYGAINLQYRTEEHLGLFAEPYISGAMMSEFKKANPADRRSTNYGVRLGISYRF